MILDALRNSSLIFRMIPTLLVMGIIFSLSAQSGDSLDLPAIPYLDKVFHFIAYGVLAAATLLVPAFHWKQRNRGATFWSCSFFCFLYALSDEYHQRFVPGRDAGMGDICADLFGAVFVLGLWYFNQR